MSRLVEDHPSRALLYTGNVAVTMLLVPNGIVEQAGADFATGSVPMPPVASTLFSALEGRFYA